MGRSKATGELRTVFAGTFGNNLRLACLVAPAARLKDDEAPIRIWIVVDGPLRGHVTDAIRGVDHLHFLSWEARIIWPTRWISKQSSMFI